MGMVESGGPFFSSNSPGSFRSGESGIDMPLLAAVRRPYSDRSVALTSRWWQIQPVEACASISSRSDNINIKLTAGILSHRTTKIRLYDRLSPRIRSWVEGSGDGYGRERSQHAWHSSAWMDKRMD